jgi:elongation factor Ts
MAEISADKVKSLRQRTGAGIMDCKNALTEVDGDEEKAVELIQKKGLAKAAKKAGAIAADGVIHAYIHAGSRLGVLVEINCQTDFVARNTEFKEFAQAVGLQIASMTPLYVRREEIPDADKEKQLALFRGQMAEEDAASGKTRPAAVADKILAGKLEKWVAESCLVEQASVVDSEKTIGQLSDDLTVKLGEKVVVRRFIRYELGEGIERKQTNLADDVAATLASN